MSKAKVAIITGASSGIGFACSKALLMAGWNTVMLARHTESMQALANELVSEFSIQGNQCFVQACDVRDASSVKAAFSAVVEKFGRIDLLFNNAGMTGPLGSIDEVSLEGWEQTLDVNLRGAFHCAQAAFSQMRNQQPQGGRIINNGSIAGQTPRPHMTPYAITKHAINGLTKCLSLDGRPFGIVCGQIDIGNVKTAMSQTFTQGMLQANGTRAPEPLFELDDVVKSFMLMAELPLEANIQNMTIMASKMPFVGRG